MRNICIAILLILSNWAVAQTETISLLMEGTEMYYSNSGCSDACGLPDPRWRISAYVPNAGSYAWNKDANNFSCGWSNGYGIPMTNWVVAYNLPANNGNYANYSMDFNVVNWEEDGQVYDFCGYPDDDYCSGYLNTWNLASYFSPGYKYYNAWQEWTCGSSSWGFKFNCIWYYNTIYSGELSANQGICEGATPAPFYNLANATSGSSYQWEYSDNGWSWNVIPNSNYTTYIEPNALTATRYYRRKASWYNSHYGNYVTAYAYTTVYVTPTPQITVNQTNVSCNGNADGIIDINILNPVSGVPYSYSIDNGNSFYVNNNQFTYLSPNTYEVVVSNGNCISAATPTITITEPAPLTSALSAAPSAITAANKICAGTPIVLNATASEGTAPYTYSWWHDANATTASITVAPKVTTTYNVTIIDAHNCVSNASVSVTITALPVANAGADKTICSGSSTPIGVAGSTVNAYSWYSPTPLYNTAPYNLNTQNIATNGTRTANPPSTTANAANPATTPSVVTYILRAFSYSTGCSKQDTMLVTVHNVPAAPSFTTSVTSAGVGGNPSNANAALCEGSTVNLAVQTPATGSVYYWYLGTTASGTGINKAITIGSTTVGNYTAKTKYSSTATCYSPASSAQALSMIAAPIPTIMASAPAVTSVNTITISSPIGSLAAINLNGAVPSGTPSTWSWYFGLNATTTLTNPIVTGAGATISPYVAQITMPTTAQTRYSKLVVDYGNTCKRASVVKTLKYLIGTTANSRMGEEGEEIEESLIETNLSAIPNPTADFITISLKGVPTNTGKLQLFNLMGQMVREENVLLKEGESEMSWDLSEFSSGMYSLVFVSEEGYRLTQKVVKE